jgi:EmrB/QacA subfamily drug resistance transporter
MTQYAPTDRNRWLALVALCGGGLLIVLDGTIVNVALPSIRHDLGVSRANLAWVVNAYLVAFGGVLLFGGRLGDLVGRRRVFVAGLAVFTLASLLCALAPSESALIAARALQGVGGGLSSSVVLGMIVTLFPDPREQARALGVNGFILSAGGAVGLLVGGVLTDAISWHWIFLVNVPVGVAAVLLALRFVDDQPGLGLHRGADLPGAVLLTSGMMLGVYAILQMQVSGWDGTPTLAWGAVSVALLTAFLARQRRIPDPLMPLRLLRLRNMNGVSVVLSLALVGPFAVWFLGALYLQLVLGYTPLKVGLAFLPDTIAAALVSLFVAGPLSIRFGARPVAVVGLVVIGVSLLLFARTPVDGRFVVDVLPPLLGFGIGGPLVFQVLTRTAMADVPAADAGLASGFMGTLEMVSAAVGLAVVATLAGQRTAALRHRGESFASALNGGYHLAYFVGAALIVVAIGVVLAVLRPRDEDAAAPGREPACDAAEVEGIVA